MTDQRSAATASHEEHTLSFEEFDLRVQVDADGNVSISFHEFGKCAFSMTWNDLREVVDFAAVHGLKMTAPYIVEMDEAERAGLT